MRARRRRRVLAVVASLLLTAAAYEGVLLVRLQRSVAASAAYWSQPHGEPGGLLYVALGDSAAQGIGASRPQNGYVGLLAERMRAQTGGPVQVVNLSRSGARIRDVLDRQLPALAALGRRPDVVTVAIGGNDVRAYDAEEFASAAADLAAALPSGTFVADVPYFMHGHWESDADQAAQVLTRDARTRGLHVVPLHQALRAQGWTAMLTQFAPDMFHPDDDGHRVWANAFWAAMQDFRPVTAGTAED